MCTRPSLAVSLVLLFRHDLLQIFLISIASGITFLKSLLTLSGTILQFFLRGSRTAGIIIIGTIGSMMSVHGISLTAIVGMT